MIDLDAKICYCFHVTRRKLMNFIRVRRPKVASQLSECGGAGTGCGWCISFLKQLHQQAVRGGETELEQLSPAEYERRRALYVRAGKGTPPPGATFPGSSASRLGPIRVPRCLLSAAVPTVRPDPASWGRLTPAARVDTLRDTIRQVS